MTTIRYQFYKLEETMIRNIANTLFQLHFHETATAEELMKYYGWTDAFEEKEREKLVEDTRTRLESEQLILAFYQKNKLTLNQKYGTKDPIGDLGLPPKRSAGEDAEQGSEREDARSDDEGGSRPSADSDTGPRHADAEADHSENEDEGDAGRTDAGPDEARHAGSDDQGRGVFLKLKSNARWNNLTKNEKRVLIHRDVDLFTLKQVGEILDITPERVRQIEAKARLRLDGKISPLKNV